MTTTGLWMSPMRMPAALNLDFWDAGRGALHPPTDFNRSRRQSHLDHGTFADDHRSACVNLSSTRPSIRTVPSNVTIPLKTGAFRER